KAESRTGVANGRLYRSGGEVLLEVLPKAGHEQILRDEAEIGASHQLRTEVPGHAQARLEVLPVTRRERTGMMHNRPQAAGDRVFRRRVEFRLLAVLGCVGRFVGPAETVVDGEVADWLPVVLQVEGIAPPARQPGGEGL